MRPLMLLLVVVTYDLPTGTVSLCLAVDSAVMHVYGYDCRAFDYAGPTVWNSLPDELWPLSSPNQIPGLFQTFLFCITHRSSSDKK